MRECVEEGVLQSYFDGELSLDMMEKVSSHLTSCLACKRAARELESESLLLSEALEPEFALSVPTERLRARIDTALAEERLLRPVRPGVAGQNGFAGRLFQSLAELFTVSPQRAFGYAGLAIVVLFGIIFALVRFRTVTPSVQNPPKVAITQDKPAPAVTPTADTPGPSQVDKGTVAMKKEPRKVKRQTFVPPVSREEVAKDVQTPFKLLPGERSYLKTIAALDTSLKSRNSRPMRASLQSEYERNLAMVDRAIAATRNAAKNNPNDPDAAEFMFAAYQTKVDLLNQVADARLPNRQQ